MLNSTRWFVVALVALGGATGCSKDSPPAVSPLASPPDATPPPVASPQSHGDAVVIAPEVKARCGIPESSDAPKFKYDSAVLGAVGIETLDALATCLTDGPMRGETLLLVGRADPRGDDDYNMNLGTERAEAVEDHLRSKGVAGASITAQSRGESDARGDDEQSWALDRRVDVTVSAPTRLVSK
jgi:peptidoglycan-associated lipoprotein